MLFYLLQFWDTRSPNPMMTLQMPERCYCADVVSDGRTCTIHSLTFASVSFELWFVLHVGLPHGSGRNS